MFSLHVVQIFTQCSTLNVLYLIFIKESPIILRDGNGTIYPMAKDCMGGIRDPDWLDLPPINSLGMGVHSLANLPSNSTIKKKAAIIIMAIEVNATFINSFIENKKNLSFKQR